MTHLILELGNHKCHCGDIGTHLTRCGRCKTIIARCSAHGGQIARETKEHCK